MRTETTDKFVQLFAALLLLLGATSLQAAELLDRIVAVVGEDVIMLSELRREAGTIFGELRAAKVSPMPSEKLIIQKALDKLVLQKVQLAEAERLGIEADPQTLAKALERIAQNNGLSSMELRNALTAEGMDYNKFRDGIKQEIILRRLQSREVTKNIQITKSEIDRYLSRANDITGGRQAVHLRHILISTPSGATPAEINDARQRAEAIVIQLGNGADFAGLAQTNSDGRQALKGGDLGWMAIADVPAMFSQPSLEMKKGDVHGPVQANNGFHIILLEDYQGGSRNIIKQTRAQHILIRTNEITSDEDARQRLRQLRKRIVNGDDFSTLARSHSDDTASAIKGGDLGWISPGNMVPEFENKMNELPREDISEPFKSRFGWHLVKVIDRREHDATRKTLRDKARQAVTEQKIAEATRQYRRRLVDEAYIELRLDDIYQD